jgi:protein TonB
MRSGTIPARRSISLCCASLILLTSLAAGARGLQPRSEADLQTMIAAQPSELGPYIELAMLYRNSQRRDEAEALLRRALTFHPKAAPVYSALATLYDPIKESEMVLSISDEWRAAAPADKRPLHLAVMVHMAKANLARGAPAEAIVHLDRALDALAEAEKIDPSDRTTRASRMVVLKQRIPLTEDPQERERLSQEFEAGAQEFTMTPPSSSSAVASATAAAPPTPTRPYPANAVRVGGNIKPPTKIKDVAPIWPPVAQQARAQGVVILEVLIDEGGKVSDGRVLRSIPLLDQAAIDAVLQWEFEPTLLNGQPVPVIMTVTVNFTLAP